MVITRVSHLMKKFGNFQNNRHHEQSQVEGHLGMHQSDTTFFVHEEMPQKTDEGKEAKR